MKKTILTSSIMLVLLSACSSNNISPYRIDEHDFIGLKNATQSRCIIKNVTMTEGDSNAILCRIAGNIYLPNKMTYSSYVRQALEKALITTDRMGNNQEDNKIRLALTKVNFDSLGGTWEIIGRLTINDSNPIEISEITEYGTSFDTFSACRNAADAFPNAVTNFIKKVIEKLK